MGYYQDNFPGSPAARQRIFVARAAVFYSLVAGFAIYAFSPIGKRLKDVKKEDLQTKGRGFHANDTSALHTNITKEEFITYRQEMEKDKGGDLAGPSLSPEEITRMYSK